MSLHQRRGWVSLILPGLSNFDPTISTHRWKALQMYLNAVVVLTWAKMTCVQAARPEKVGIFDFRIGQTSPLGCLLFRRVAIKKEEI